MVSRILQCLAQTRILKSVVENPRCDTFSPISPTITMKVHTLTLLPHELYISIESLHLPFHSSSSPFIFIQSHGFYRLHHPELVLLLAITSGSSQTLPSTCPASIKKYFRSLYRFTKSHPTALLTPKDYTEFSNPLLGVYKGFLYSRQPLPEILTRRPLQVDYLLCLGVTQDELHYAKLYGPTRILSNLARVYRYFPTPCWNHPREAYTRRVFHLEHDHSGMEENDGMAPKQKETTDEKDSKSNGSILDALTHVIWPSVFVFVQELKHLVLRIDMHTSPHEILEDLKALKKLSLKELQQQERNTESSATNVPIYVSFAIMTHLNSSIPTYLCWRGDAPPTGRESSEKNSSHSPTCIISKPGASISSQLGGSFLGFAPHDSVATFRTVEDGFVLFLPPSEMNLLMEEFMRMAEFYTKLLEEPSLVEKRATQYEQNSQFELSLEQECTFRIEFPSMEDVVDTLNRTNSDGTREASGAVMSIQSVSGGGRIENHLPEYQREFTGASGHMESVLQSRKLHTSEGVKFDRTNQ